MSQEVISILEKYLSNPMIYNKNFTREFISLSGAWDDDRTAEEIIHDIKKNRIKPKRFDADDVIFD